MWLLFRTDIILRLHFDECLVWTRRSFFGRPLAAIGEGERADGAGLVPPLAARRRRRQQLCGGGDAIRASGLHPAAGSAEGSLQPQRNHRGAVHRGAAALSGGSLLLRDPLPSAGPSPVLLRGL